ncbi:hypothetical protein [Staphylococcus haemolyticus]|uniref:hypothetical protein n=1 Tax=Staphylococcus haemolyticus TaxID=1283 RepID=UPI001F2BD9F7|nr:hypothetical protein [Staphylococcus haemolyticus]MCE4963071.1 hypothetical protein [Staphylococcus haemolyticus]MCE4993129.1 hypothetical protein [Staphylococcus haemolyticus]
MANEIVNKKESYILVQINSKNEENIMYNDYRGQFYTTPNHNMATEFDDVEKAEKMASRLNALNDLNLEFGIITEEVTIKVAKKIIDIAYIEKSE